MLFTGTTESTRTCECFVYCACCLKSTLIVLFRTYSYQFVNVHTHFHTGKYSLTEKGEGRISHVVNVSGSSNETYTVTVMDKHGWIHVINVSNLTAVEIPFEWLKPCTTYNVSVNGCKPIGGLNFNSSSKWQLIPTPLLYFQ